MVFVRAAHAGFAVLVAATGCAQLLGIEELSSECGDAGASAGCVVDPRCASATTEGACLVLDCMWTSGATCAGTHQDCLANSSVFDCALHTGCAWDDEGPCEGTHAACGTISQAECGAHGCTVGSCRGTHSPCGDFDFSGSSVCNSHGCVYYTPGCSGIHESCDNYDSTDASTCEGHGCTWGGSLCTGVPHSCSEHAEFDTGDNCTNADCSYTAPMCTGTPHSCCSLGTCSGHPGCSAGTSCCGNPHACAADGELTCGAGGCTWDAMDCSGTPEPCSTHSPEGVCAQHAACYWSPDGACAAPLDCSSRDQASCTNGCVWDEDPC